MRRVKAGKFKSLDDYGRHLRSNPAEVKALYNDILIQVTGFFRDPFVFNWLKKNCLSPLANKKGWEMPIRVWVPACSTGEEAYSLAIVLAELVGANGHRPFQIFGTDVNEAVLEKARAGIYDATIKKQVSEERLHRFFEPVSGGFRVHKNIRDACVFARHNLAADPPISNLDLISCRNVLIYLKPALQQRIIPVFHFGLKPDGLLLLGSSETVGNNSALFSLKEKKVKAYARQATKLKTIPASFQPLHVPALPGNGEVPARPASRKAGSKEADLRAAVDKIILGNAGVTPEQARVVPLSIPQSEEKVYIVFVDPEKQESSRMEPSKTPMDARGYAAAASEIERLRKELFVVRESLQTIIGQEAAANDELRAANEEIISSNEELQSTNEELETTKEELQSANEELTTLNNELENRNSELERANLISSRFQAIVESSDDAIIAKDLNGIIQSWNKGAEKIFGYTAEEVVGKSVTILIPPEHHDEEPVILARVRAGERVDHYQTIRKRKDGRLIDISLTVSPIKNSVGQIVGASKIARDITDRNLAIAELKRAHDEIARTSQAKDDFLAMLSHELRTPLNPVLLISSDAAANLDLPPGIRANFDLIRRSVEMESRLIDDLLDLTRIKSGKLKIEKQETNIYDVLADAVSMVQSEIEQKKIDLSQNLENSQSVISGDKTRLQQIFWNVLKNAIKFSPPEGKIAIHAYATEGCYVVKITDTGIGMTPEELAQAFEPFRQGEHSAQARRFGGLGLGLTITKKLVELHSGEIGAFSAGRNLGSTFTMKFPLFDWMAHPGRSKEATVYPEYRDGRRLDILLVEDHDMTRNTLARLLVDRHHKVSIAISVQEALAMAEKKDFDLVISDIGLPDGNGCDLFQRIRGKSPGTKGIALSGYGMREDVARSKESGFYAHLIKPIDMRALEKALARALVEEGRE